LCLYYRCFLLQNNSIYFHPPALPSHPLMVLQPPRYLTVNSLLHFQPAERVFHRILRASHLRLRMTQIAFHTLCILLVIQSIKLFKMSVHL
jgi:hypothetical protein